MGNYNGNLKIFTDEWKWRVIVKLHEVLKAILWFKFIALNNCINKEEMPKINIIKQHFRFSLREDTTLSIYIYISKKAYSIITTERQRWKIIKDSLRDMYADHYCLTHILEKV